MVRAVAANDFSDEGGWPLLVVVGPTASGKTALAMRLAIGLGSETELGGEIVSCDSVAVYRGMDVGSAKPTAEERARVLHHGLDLYWPDEACTAGDWARAAKAAVEEVRERGRVPIVAGGTGLYLRALLEGLAPAPGRDEDLRERLMGIVARRGAGWLHRVLVRMDEKAAGAIHANDVPKVIRAVEVTLAARKPQTQVWAKGREALRGYRVLQMGMGGGREELYRRIDARAAGMFERGLLEETAGLRAKYGDSCRQFGALGYAQAMAMLRGEMSREDAVKAAQQGHRNYAKRQGTWFRKVEAIRWLHGFGDEVKVQDEALRMAKVHVMGERA